MHNAELIITLEKLFSLEPSLAEDLEKAAHLDQAVEHIVAAAGRHDLSVDASDLSAWLNTVKAGVAKGEIDDEQLAGVTGGLTMLGTVLALLSRVRVRFE